MDRSLTIAHVLGSLHMGGAERVALDLATAQRQRGHRVLLVSLDPGPEGPLGAAVRSRALAVHELPKRPGIDVTLPPRAAGWFRREKVTVVHTHNPQPLIYTAAAGRMVGAAVVHTKHGEGHQGSRGEKLLRRLAARWADVFVAVSETTAAQARAQKDCPRDRLTVIANGIELTDFAPDPQTRLAVRTELGIPASAWVVGTVGRVDRNKNQTALVRAVASLVNDDFHLVIVGDGPAMGDLRQAVAALPRSKFVHVLGRRLDVNRLLASFDVFALSSLSEGLPLVIPEAMASALPVISTAVGGIPAVVIEGETGYLVPPGEAAALGARLSQLAADRDHAAALGSAGRERALAEHSAERMAGEYLALYQRALRARSQWGRANWRQ